MDRLKNKSYKSYDCISRYSAFPYFYNEEDDKFVYGITNWLSEDTTYVEHEVKRGDTLDSLSLTYYGRPDYYWVIADFNRILDPFARLSDKFTKIKIPTISSIKYRRK